MWRVSVIRDCGYVMGYGAAFVLHVGSVAVLFGSGRRGRGPRLELCTPFHWFRWSPGFRG